MKKDEVSVRHDPFEIEQREWRQRQTKERLKQMLTIASPIFLLLLWEFLSRTEIIDIRFFPPPSAIVGTFFEMITSGEMAGHIGVSLYRIFAGVLTADVADDVDVTEEVHGAHHVGDRLVPAMFTSLFTHSSSTSAA